MSEVVRRRLLVDGRVQNVFFRESCRREALAAGVTGRARNLGDGRVEVVLEGAPEAVARVVAWCRQGPPQAFVIDVVVAEEEPEGLSGFAVS
ncbi:MAG TPA: acylphosphatase [Acidimicrobiales bacterium]|nr:acylphosphatase [Acidimicrobiales bacterium]